ncbi:UNVERIFIED_CONTAM: hypothetical protein HHA_450060 [Hammondia hammondi]|eukprot:XP_008882698.1 hypothetical protein HHA_450060 [Hammondia hammondi]
MTKITPRVQVVGPVELLKEELLSELVTAARNMREGGTELKLPLGVKRFPCAECPPIMYQYVVICGEADELRNSKPLSVLVFLRFSRSNAIHLFVTIRSVGS